MSEPAGARSPALIGVLYDFPQFDGGASVEEAIALGLAEGAGARADRPFELVARQARGLPAGSEHEMAGTFLELAETGVLAVVGPSISDNGLIVAPLADRLGLPCINYTGGEITRSAWMFHYQVGSLQEEPVVMVEHLARRNLSRVAALYDASPVGRNYVEAFTAAAARVGLEVTGTAALSALAEDVTPTVGALVGSGPEAVAYLGLGVAARAVALALKAVGWNRPVVANSSLMFGYTRKDWRADWEGWVYVDTVADDNRVRQALRERSRRTAAGPVGVAAYDIGRLLGEAVVRADHLTRDGIRRSLETVKRLPAASGRDGTTMGFGNWDHAALKGESLVLRVWRDGRTVQLAEV
jgi:ABC-type branched-subunit amino acid transport system substrate-binding protein